MARTGRASDDFPRLAHFATLTKPMAQLRKWVESGESEGRAEWRRALAALDYLTVPVAEDAVRTLRCCVRQDSAAKVTFSTVHASKGLSWETVIVNEDWYEKSGPDVARLCYVALTRAQLRLLIPTRLYAKLY